MRHTERVLHATQMWIGTPYRHQASTLGAGCDCLGLIRGVWRELYNNEPTPILPYPMDPRRDGDHGALQRAADDYLDKSHAVPQVGDVILLQLRRGFPPRHCGILISENSFVHAQERLGVVTAKLTEGWSRRIVSAYSFPMKAD